MAEDSEEKHILRMMITTDNHLGVWEKDEVRKNDSFQAFDEVLQKAVDMNVDLVLLGGDLFHENKPSRTTVVKSISSLKKHCLKKRPVLFQVLSDRTKNFVSGTVNTEDPNLSIGLPVFTIHGNHDDPTGADNLSAVDILSSCGLVNYFGKVLITPGATASTSTGNIDISPVLLRKGDTRVALYGLGNIRDERLGRMFNTAGCVNWARPESTPDYPLDDWFNLFVLHQNRVQHGPQAKNCVLESMLPSFLDLIVWGHEHECKPDTEPSRSVSTQDAPTLILQPGSTVATALSEGEAARKHCFVLEVLGNSWRIQKHSLDSQRPFAFETVVLRDVTRPAVLRAEDQEGITAFLEEKVNDMISKATTDRQPAPGSSPMLPLIRLRVDYTGFTTINAQRFGQKFVGKVANPHDMITFTKAMTKRVKAEGGPVGRVDEDLLRPEALDQARIEDLIAENLQEKLKLLKEEELGLALHNFVEKDEKGALAECVMSELDARLRGTATRKVLAIKTSDNELREQFAAAAVEDKYEKVSPRKATLPATGGDGGDTFDDDMLGGGGEGERPAAKGRKAAGAAKAPTQSTSTAAKGRGRGRGTAAAKATQGGAGRGRGAGGPRQLSVLETFGRSTQQPSQVQQTATDPVADDDFAAQEDPVARPRPAARAKAASAGTQDGAFKSRSRAATASPVATKKRAASKQSLDDDEDIEDDTEGGGTMGVGGSGRTPSRRTLRQQPPKKKARVDSDDAAGLSDDDDEYDGIEKPSSGDDDEELEDSRDERPGRRQKPAPGPKKRAAPPKKAPARTPAKKAAKTAVPASRSVPDHDVIDVISSDDEEENRAGNSNGQQARGTQQTAVTATPAAPVPLKLGGRSVPSSMTNSAGPSQANTQKRTWGQAR